MRTRKESKEEPSSILSKIVDFIFERHAAFYQK
jgi:hypothetical protein